LNSRFCHSAFKYLSQEDLESKCSLFLSRDIPLMYKFQAISGDLSNIITISAEKSIDESVFRRRHEN